MALYFGFPSPYLQVMLLFPRAQSCGCFLLVLAQRFDSRASFLFFVLHAFRVFLVFPAGRGSPDLPCRHVSGVGTTFPLFPFALPPGSLVELLVSPLPSAMFSHPLPGCFPISKSIVSAHVTTGPLFLHIDGNLFPLFCFRRSLSPLHRWRRLYPPVEVFPLSLLSSLVLAVPSSFFLL